MALPTRPLRDILPLVIPQAPGVSEMAAEQALRIAAAEFCVKTRLWREIFTATIYDEAEPVLVPDHCVLHEIESAYWEGQTPLTPVRFAATSPEDRSVNCPNPGTPVYITQSAHNTITVVPFAIGDLTITAIMKPAEGPEFGVLYEGQTAQDRQNVIPAFMFQQYANTIADGALARLLLTPKTEWYDPQRAAVHQTKFDTSTDGLINAPIKGQHRAQRRTRSHWF